jgi:hypothetical protein
MTVGNEMISGRFKNEVKTSTLSDIDLKILRVASEYYFEKSVKAFGLEMHTVEGHRFPAESEADAKAIYLRATEE